MQAARKNKSASSSSTLRQRRPLQSFGPVEFGTSADGPKQQNGDTCKTNPEDFSDRRLHEDQLPLEFIARRIESHISAQIFDLENRFCKGIVGDLALLRAEVSAVYALIYELHCNSCKVRNNSRSSGRPAEVSVGAMSNPQSSYSDPITNGWTQAVPILPSSPHLPKESSTSRSAARRQAAVARYAVPAAPSPPETDPLEQEPIAVTSTIVARPSLLIEDEAPQPIQAYHTAHAVGGAPGDGGGGGGGGGSGGGGGFPPRFDPDSCSAPSSAAAAAEAEAWGGVRGPLRRARAHASVEKSPRSRGGAGDAGARGRAGTHPRSRSGSDAGPHREAGAQADRKRGGHSPCASSAPPVQPARALSLSPQSSLSLSLSPPSSPSLSSVPSLPLLSPPVRPSTRALSLALLIPVRTSIRNVSAPSGPAPVPSRPPTTRPAGEPRHPTRRRRRASASAATDSPRPPPSSRPKTPPLPETPRHIAVTGDGGGSPLLPSLLRPEMRRPAFG